MNLLNALIMFLLGAPLAHAEGFTIKAFKKTDSNVVSPSDVHDLVEDSRGLIYAADSTGVLEFDGIQWQKIALEGAASARALGTDNSGRVYVGGTGTIGFLSPDSTGKMIFRSLLDKIPEAERQFLEGITKVEQSGTQTAFVTDKRLFLWNHDQVTVVPVSGTAVTAIGQGDSLFVIDDKLGLMKQSGAALTPVSGGSFVGISAGYADKDRRIVGVSPSEGIVGLEFADDAVRQVALLRQDRGVFSGTLGSRIVTVSGYITVGTYGKGLLVFEPVSLKFVPISEAIKKQIGPDVHSLIADRNGQLWVGTPGGVFVVRGPWTSQIADDKVSNEFSAYVRSCLSMKDQIVVFGGTFFDTVGGVQRKTASDLNKPELPFTQNALRFSYASSELVKADEVTYQTLLQGFDTEWTEWSSRNYREFTNLMWKKYAFKVRAKHPDGRVSEITQFEFNMTPPWNERYWFHFLQFGIIGLLIVGVSYLKGWTKHTNIADKLNGVVVGTIWSYTFSKVGVSSVIASMTGGAAFFSIIVNGFMGIYLKPLQKRLEGKILRLEDRMIKRYRKPPPEGSEVQSPPTPPPPASQASGPDERRAA